MQWEFTCLSPSKLTQSDVNGPIHIDRLMQSTKSASVPGLHRPDKTMLAMSTAAKMMPKGIPVLDSTDSRLITSAFTQLATWTAHHRSAQHQSWKCLDNFLYLGCHQSSKADVNLELKPGSGKEPFKTSACLTEQMSCPACCMDLGLGPGTSQPVFKKILKSNLEDRGTNISILQETNITTAITHHQLWLIGHLCVWLISYQIQTNPDLSWREDNEPQTGK